MSDLNPEAKALFQSARPGLSPTSSDRARVAEALRARLAAPPVASSSMWPKLVGGGAVVVTVAGLVWWAASLSARPAQPPETLAPVVAPAVLPPIAEPVAPPSVPKSAAVAPTKPAAQRPRAETAERTQATIVVETPAPPVEVVAPPDAGTENTLGEELRLLKLARGAAQQARPLDALAMLAEHASRFPHGILEEERRALNAFALCAAGRASEARAEAEAVLRNFPRSPHANRLRSVCPDR